MKIFFISRGWPSEREPQWGCFERDQALALKKLGHQVVVLSVDVRFRWYSRKYGITKDFQDGITRYNFFAGSIWGRVLISTSISLHVKIRRLFFLYLFKNVIKEEGVPDLLYSHYLQNSSMTLVAKQKYGIPVIGIEHWSELGYENIKDGIKKWAQNTYKDLDQLLTVSSALQENILKNFGVNSVVVNNMVGNDFIELANCPQKHIRGGKLKFVTVGNLIPRKGLDYLIESLHILTLPKDSWEMNIVGDGPERNKLTALIDKYNLYDNVKLLGAKDRKGVIETLCSNDVFVLASLSETFGVVVIEALACGLPVIVTDCGGTKDIINSQNGVMCPVKDPQKLAECFTYMMNNYRNYDSVQIVADCQTRFSSDSIGKQLEGIFEEVIRKNKQ